MVYRSANSSAPKVVLFWLARFDPIEGREQAGVRPALVLSVDSFNASRADLVAVLPITSKPRAANPFPSRCSRPKGGLTVVSYVIGEQVRTVTAGRRGPTVSCPRAPRASGSRALRAGGRDLAGPRSPRAGHGGRRDGRGQAADADERTSRRLRRPE
jgi:mRNA interferase MazF